MRSASNKITAIAATLTLVAALAAPAQAHKPRHSKQAKGTLIVSSYLAGAGKPGAPELPPELFQSSFLRVYASGRLIREVAGGSHIRIELKPGPYVVRAGCGVAKAVVHPDTTTTVRVYCYRE